ncbi:MAG: hypothetical protein ACPGDB_02270, partial [Fusobacterium sp.]
MKFVKFIPKNSQKETLGILSKCEKFIIELKSINSCFNFNSTLELIENVTEDNISLLNHINILNNLENYNIFSIKNVNILSPFKQTKHDIICAGFNYMDHLKEIKKDIYLVLCLMVLDFHIKYLHNVMPLNMVVKCFMWMLIQYF